MDPSNQNPPRFTATALGCLERNGKKYYRGATAASSVNAAEAENAARALAELHGLCSRQEELCFRVYATKAGLRYLCTSRLFDPVSAESQNILSSLRADKRYAALCRVQKCYRARLSPKLRRCVVARPKPAGLFARLLSAGPKKKIDPSAFATCRYLETVGQTKTIIPDIEMIVELHDELTESVSAKPLA